MPVVGSNPTEETKSILVVGTSATVNVTVTMQARRSYKV